MVEWMKYIEGEKKKSIKKTKTLQELNGTLLFVPK